MQLAKTFPLFHQMLISIPGLKRSCKNLVSCCCVEPEQISPQKWGYSIIKVSENGLRQKSNLHETTPYISPKWPGPAWYYESQSVKGTGTLIDQLYKDLCLQVRRSHFCNFLKVQQSTVEVGFRMWAMIPHAIDILFLWALSYGKCLRSFAGKMAKICIFEQSY